MDVDDTNFMIFEAVPLERLGITDIQEVFHDFSSALQSIGYKLIKGTKQSLWFEVDDKNSLFEAASSQFGSAEQYRYGYTWLVTEYYHSLSIQTSQYDILFALASDKDRETKDPFDVPAHYLSSEIGGLLYPPTIPRILTSAALWKYGKKHLADRIDCKTNSPNETALAGDIKFYKPPLTYNLKIRDEDLGADFIPLSIINTNLLTSQQLVNLLHNETLLDHVEIAKAMPFNFFASSTVGDDKDKHIIYWWNHFSIRAIYGSAQVLIRELLEISLHLNWSQPSSMHDTPIPSEQAFRFAISQRSRLRKLESEEQRIQHGLDILQRRYPDKPSLFEWQVNNIYTNIVRYSPIYLSWKAHLESYLRKGVHWQTWITNRLEELDWIHLSTTQSASPEDAERLISLTKVDPGSALTKMRVIVEKIIEHVYHRTFQRLSNIPLARMITEINEKNVFPSIIYVCLNALRQAGNVGAHGADAEPDDVMAILPLFIRVVPQ